MNARVLRAEDTRVRRGTFKKPVIMPAFFVRPLARPDGIMREMSELLDRTVVVLCRPEESGNVGSVCRAMKTMGITRLRIVGESRFDAKRIEHLSVHAYDVFEAAGFYGSLKEALRDTALSAGFTRRKGKKRKTAPILPEEFAERAGALSGGVVAAVFGNERSGLSDEELRECSLAVRIPSSPRFPSLNLSHAVQIAGYALLRAETRPSRFVPVARDRIEALTASIVESLDEIGFFTVSGSSVTEEFLRDILTRAALSKGEADRVERLFRKIQNLKIHRPARTSAEGRMDSLPISNHNDGN